MRVTMNIPLTRYDGVFSWDQPAIDKLVQAAIDVAVKVGIRLEDDSEGFYLKEAAQKGAGIDRNVNSVMLRRKHIEQTIGIMRETRAASASLRPPGKSRNPEEKFLVGNGANLLFDWANWNIKPATKKDLIELCAFAQGCQDVDCLFAPVMLKDINQFLEPIYNYAVTARHCRKKVLHEQATEPFHVKYLDRMARVVERRRGYFQPMQQYEYVNPPFKLGLRAVETMLARVDTGACSSMGIGSMIVSGMTAPVTVPEAAVSTVAEILAALAFFNLLRPGYGLEAVVCTGNMNLKNGNVSYFNMRAILQNLAAWELIERGLGIHCGVLSWYRDANEPGMQALYEYGMAQTFFSCVHSYAGPEIGGLACGNVFSPGQAVLDMEIIKEFNELTGGFDVSPDGPAVEDIISGRFDSKIHMSTEHTLRNMRENLPFSDFLFRGLPAATRHDKNSTQTDGLLHSAAAAVKAAVEKGRKIEPDEEIGEELFEYVREAASELGIECPQAFEG